MKERPILFNGEMVRAILDGRKTQTRRPVNPQPLALYRLTGDSLSRIHTDNEAIERCYPEAYSSIPELRLHGGGRWEDLLTNQVCRIWAEGVRGLVSIERAQHRKGVQIRFTVSREQESDSACSQVGLYGVSRDAVKCKNASSASGWKPAEQHSIKPEMGNPGGELDRQERARQGKQRGKASRIKAVGRAKIEHSLGNLKGIVQPKDGCAPPWDVPSVYLANSPLQIGTRLWVRETWQAWRMTSLEYNEWDVCDCAPSEIHGTYGMPNVEYAATSDSVGPWRPSIHMPRWASRITLEITAVRVERVQDITEEDAMAEGATCPYRGEKCGGYHPEMATVTEPPECVCIDGYKPLFKDLWQSIYRNWDANPWVWVYEFRRVKP